MFKLAHTVVWHKRLRPKVNKFKYKVFYLCFSLKNIPKLAQVTKLDKFGISAFYNKDHGKRDRSSLEKWINEVIKPFGVVADDIILLTYPRVLGYVFNPVSFWYCLKNGELVAVLAEVNNTFGESHNYLVLHKNLRPILPDEKFTSPKNFHVSPFMHVNGYYTFRFGINENNCFADIYHHDDAGGLIETSIHSKLEDLTKNSLRKALQKNPLMTFMVIALIHWQALKLFFLRIKYNNKPTQKSIKLTVAYENEEA